MSSSQAILQLLLTPGLGARTLSDLLDRAESTGLDPAQIVTLDADELAREFGLQYGIAEAISLYADEAASIAERLDEYSIQMLKDGHEDYPDELRERLGRKAPPVLFVRGNMELLGERSITFSGSRQADDASLQAAQRLATILARDGVNIVSGMAPGTDMTAHAAAMDAGGSTTIVLAEGIFGFRPSSEIARLLSNDNFLVVSEFIPTDRWSTFAAMQRNLTMAGLAGMVVVVQPGLSGGTYEMGKLVLEHGLPLLVLRDINSVLPEGSAEMFVRRGGIEIDVGEIGDRDDLLELISSLRLSTDLFDTD